VISSVRGTVLSASGSAIVIEVGGIGLLVQVTPQLALASRVGSEATVHTALIVREDDLSLYGFADTDELTTFDLLRGVTGVGPKSAIGVLAAMSPGEIARAVSVEDDAAFRKVSGIGPKTAKLIVLSLAGKLHVAASTKTATTGARTSSTSESVTLALVGLGWPERVAMNAVDEAMKDASNTDRASVQAVLRLALAQLGPQGGGTA
jgi:Holliday junction DNA helicase RuvA